MSNDKAEGVAQDRMDLFDKARRISRVDLKITFYDGQLSTENMNHSIHRMLSDRKFLAQKIVERGLYEEMTHEMELLKKYSEELRRILDL